MNDRRDNTKLSNMSIGYITVMMIFAVICLTILAVLSFQTADSGSALTERNAEYTRQYYEADSKAKQTLMLLDKAAAEAQDSGFFEDVFPSAITKISDITLSPTMGGAYVHYNTEINNRLSLSATIKFYSSPQNGNRYEITEWNTVAADSADTGLNVWDGDF